MFGIFGNCISIIAAIMQWYIGLKKFHKTEIKVHVTKSVCGNSINSDGETVSKSKCK